MAVSPSFGRAQTTGENDHGGRKLSKGNMNGGASASPRSVRRSRRPQTRLRNFMHESRETSGMPATENGSQDGGRRLRPHGSHARLRGVTQRHSTDESFEQRRNARRRRVRREGC